MCSRSFLREGAKIKQRTSSKKELCENGKETIWESRFTSFLVRSIYRKKKATSGEVTNLVFSATTKRSRAGNQSW